MNKKACMYIRNKCLQNGINEPTIFTHKCGAVLTVTPCTADPGAEYWDEVDFFLTDCDKVYLPGCDTLEQVANILLDLDKIIDENEQRKRQLALRKDKIDMLPEGEEKEYQLQMYSDDYKSCYGFRPKRA